MCYKIHLKELSATCVHVQSWEEAQYPLEKSSWQPVSYLGAFCTFWRRIRSHLSKLSYNIWPKGFISAQNKPLEFLPWGRRRGQWWEDELSCLWFSSSQHVSERICSTSAASGGSKRNKKTSKVITYFKHCWRLKDRTQGLIVFIKVTLNMF